MSTQHFVLIQNILYAYTLCVHVQHIFNGYTHFLHMQYGCVRVLIQNTF